MNDIMRYDEGYMVEYFEDIFPKYTFPKPTQKTITVEKNGLKGTIKVIDIKVSNKTYWSIKGYDAQFEGKDANCWLCGWYGMDYGECKCKKYFTLDEHKENIKLARKNYLISLCENYFKDYVSIVKNLNDEEINKLLFDDSTGIRILKLEFPHWSTREIEVKKMYLYLNTKLKNYETTLN